MRDIVSPLDGIRSPFGQRRAFDPRYLFSAGEVGAWYDSSDFSTMFQDAAGTTPVTAVEQPVGLIRDKSGRGNHASQTTSTSRPVLSARVNLLTYTEQFNNAAWTKSNVTVSANATTAPDGTSTADAVLETVTSGAHQVFQSVIAANATYVFSVCIKANGRDYCAVSMSDGSSGDAAIGVDLINGTTFSVNAFYGASSWTNVSATIAAAGNGFYRVNLTATKAAGTVINATVRAMSSNSVLVGSFSYAGDTTKGLFIWGADLRSSTAGSSLPPYQRVGAATAGSSSAAGTGDYDTTGFPYYLSFDGTDDFLVTGTINPGSVDKAQVFAGVRKLSDAAAQIIAEHTGAWTSATGSLALYQDSSSSSQYAASARGNAAVNANQVASIAAGYAAPATNVLTATHDISGDSSILRANGTQIATSSGDKGAGNFASAAMYIGRRGGITLPFNGRLYGLIVRFSAANLSDADISRTETWLNAKTLAY